MNDARNVTNGRTRRARTTTLGITLGLVALAGGFVAGRAHADGIPATAALTYTGTLEDVSGAPLTGAKQLVVALFDAQSNGTQKCTVSQSVALVAGRFQVLLPDTCTQAVQAKPDLWVEVTVDGTSLGRTKLMAVPYAAEASHAVNATNATRATNADNATHATNADNATSAANATGALQTTLASLTQRISTLEGAPKPLTKVDRVDAVSGDSYFTECANSSGVFVQGACDRMAYYKCTALGYVGGWFEGDILNNHIGLQCVK